MRCSENRVLNLAKLSSNQFFLLKAQQGFYLGVAVCDYAALAGRSNTKNHRGFFPVLTLAVGSTTTESRDSEVLFGISSKLLASLMVVADSEAVSGVTQNVVNSLVALLAQRFEFPL